MAEEDKKKEGYKPGFFRKYGNLIRFTLIVVVLAAIMIKVMLES